METESSSPTPPPNVDPEKTARDWAMFTHLSGLCCLLSIPSVAGPLVCWLVKKDQIPRVDAAGKNAMNFQLTMLIVQVISIPLMFIVIGFFTLFAAAILSIVYSIIAGVAANKGVDYVYPMSFKFIK